MARPKPVEQPVMNQTFFIVICGINFYKQLYKLSKGFKPLESLYNCQSYLTKLVVLASAFISGTSNTCLLDPNMVACIIAKPSSFNVDT